jgi:flagellar protein FlgJ
MKIGDPKMAQQLSLEHISTQVPTQTRADDSPEAIREVARTFESLFLNEIMKNMRKTLPEDGLLNGGFANNVFNSMLDQEYSSIASQSGQFGLAEVIARQLGADPLPTPQSAESTADRMVMVDGEEIPAWALEEIQADPWSPGAQEVDPKDPQRVTPGLSAPAQSDFGGISPSAGAKARQAYEQITALPPSSPRVKR